MKVTRLEDVEGRRYPAGRRTKPLVGSGLNIEADGFCMGHVELEPNGGQVPWHCHPNEEAYLVLEGSPQLALGDEVRVLSAGDCVYIPGGTYHQLTNLSGVPARFVYCYAPAGDVDHWKQELDGTLPRAGEGAPPLPKEAAPQR